MSKLECALPARAYRKLNISDLQLLIDTKTTPMPLSYGKSTKKVRAYSCQTHETIFSPVSTIIKL